MKYKYPYHSNVNNSFTSNNPIQNRNHIDKTELDDYKLSDHITVKHYPHKKQ